MDFFFQAEDGIRDGHVTGVQTCALPISQTITVDIIDDLLNEPDETATLTLTGADYATLGAPASGTLTIVDDDRSEERRVGKECRSRRRPERYKKKTE